jgi:phage FluMu protein Com
MRELKQLEVDKLKDSKLNYIGIIEESKKKIVFLCKNHGKIEQRFDVHIKNLKCPKCKTLNNNKYTKEYISNLIIKYRKPYKYLLEKDIYNVQDKISIECKEHGIFEQRLHNHFNLGQMCKKCSNENRTGITDKLNKWLLENNISILKYNGYKSKNKSFIECHNKHKFLTTIENLKENGCPICAENNRLIKEREKFIENSKVIWGNEFIDFDYSTLVYNGKRKLFTMKSDVGIISQLPDNHLNGFLPRKSTGETIIESILNKYSIFYEREKTFDGCINKKKLRFDFYIPEKNICIEYNGIQHYQKVDRFGGEETFNYQKYNDSIKSNFCKENSINLLIISYKDSIIEKMKELII